MVFFWKSCEQTLEGLTTVLFVDFIFFIPFLLDLLTDATKTLIFLLLSWLLNDPLVYIKYITTHLVLLLKSRCSCLFLLQMMFHSDFTFLKLEHQKEVGLSFSHQNFLDWKHQQNHCKHSLETSIM